MAQITFSYRSKIDELLSSGKRKSYFVAAVTVFFILLMSFAGIIPAISALGQQAEENRKRDEIVNKLNIKLGRLKDFVRESEEKKDTISYFSEVFPDKISQEKVLNNLIDFADKNNVKIAAFNYGKSQTLIQEGLNETLSDNAKHEALSMNGEGTLQNILSFTKDLEASRRLMNLTTSTITRKTGQALIDSQGSRDYAFFFDLTYYYFDTTVVTEAIEQTQ